MLSPASSRYSRSPCFRSWFRYRAYSVVVSRKQFIVRTGFWLAFLVTTLTSSFIYLSEPPTPVGTGLLRVFGWGALAGIVLGALVYVLHRPLHGQRTPGGKLKALFGVAAMGVFGGAAGAALLDQSRIVDAQAVELPIVRIERLPARRRATALQIATLAPLDPTYEDHLAASKVSGKWVKEGACLVGVVEHGWLGATWVRRYTARPCARIRGASSSSIITGEADFRSWRWYTPGINKPDGEGRRIDTGLPFNLTCRTRQGSWLYRCTSKPASAPHGR